MLRAGEVGQKDTASAARWFTKAADGGHADAASELGVMYLTGEGVPADERGAAFWFDRADELEGNPGALAEARSPSLWDEFRANPGGDFGGLPGGLLDGLGGHGGVPPVTS